MKIFFKKYAYLFDLHAVRWYADTFILLFIEKKINNFLLIILEHEKCFSYINI